MLVSLCYVVLGRLLQLVLLCLRSNDFKELEIVVLRHELAVLRRRTGRPTMTWSDRCFLAAASRLLPRSRWASFFVTPATQVRLASAAGRQAVDVRTSSRPPAPLPRAPSVGPAHGAREPAVGLSAHRRRTEGSGTCCYDGAAGLADSPARCALPAGLDVAQPAA